MNSVIRLCCCVNRVISGNPQFCCDSITDLLEENESLHADLSLFPRLALCPPSSGNLLYNSAVLSQCEQALDQLLLASSKNSSCVIVGLPKRIGGQVMDVIAVIQNGELLALLPACGSGMLSSADPLLGYWENDPQEKLFGWDTLFCCGDLRFCICPCPVQELPLHLPRLAKTGCHAVLVPSYRRNQSASAASGAGSFGKLWHRHCPGARRSGGHLPSRCLPRARPHLRMRSAAR